MTEELLQILFMDQIMDEDVKTDKDEASTIKQEVKKTETSNIWSSVIMSSFVVLNHALFLPRLFNGS